MAEFRAPISPAGMKKFPRRRHWPRMGRAPNEANTQALEGITVKGRDETGIGIKLDEKISPMRKLAKKKKKIKGTGMIKRKTKVADRGKGGEGGGRRLYHR